jgi:Integrase core domain
MVFTTRLSGGKGGRNGFENELHRLGVIQINSTPNHPTTCGKIERFHQTLKKWPTGQPRAATLAQLQTQLDAFVEAYNHDRPHRSLPHQATPATAYTARPKADPATRTDTHNRVRRDRIDQAGVITLRVAGRLHHIGVGRTYTGTRVLVLVQDLHIRIIHAATGEPIRPANTEPQQGLPTHGAPKGPNGKSSEPNAGSELFRCLETSHASG